MVEGERGVQEDALKIGVMIGVGVGGRRGGGGATKNAIEAGGERERLSAGAVMRGGC